MNKTIGIQLFVSVALLVAATAIVLVCEVLRASNLRLREQNLRLRIREEERERRMALLRAVPETAAEAGEARQPRPAAAVRAGFHLPASQAAAAPVAQESSLGPAAAGELDPRNANARESSPGSLSSRRRPRKRPEEISPAIREIAAWVEKNGELLERNARANLQNTAGGLISSATFASRAGGSSESEYDRTAAQVAQPASERLVIELGAPRQVSVLRRVPQQGNVNGNVRRAGVGRLLEGAALESWRKSSAPCHGLIMAISVRHYQRLMQHPGFRPHEIDALMETLAGSRGRVYQSDEGQFALIFEGVGAGEAQRISSEVAECLWDFQLRHIGSFSVTFHCGSWLAAGETPAEALEAAKRNLNGIRSERTPRIQPLAEAPLSLAVNM